MVNLIFPLKYDKNKLKHGNMSNCWYLLEKKENLKKSFFYLSPERNLKLGY